jgi:uncharacterized protein YodC (DUF2158 family)
MTIKALEVGEIVSLKSGGVAMTLESLTDADGSCVWMDRGKVRRDTFPLLCLRRGTDEHDNIGTLIISGITHSQAEVDAMLKVPEHA